MVNMEWVKEQARPGGFDDAAPVKKLEGHAFCTGHTYMGGTNAIFFAEAADREFSSEYAQVHGMKTIPGPGRAHQPDWRSKRRAPVDLPHSGPPSGERRSGSGECQGELGDFVSATCRPRPKSTPFPGMSVNPPIAVDPPMPLTRQCAL